MIKVSKRIKFLQINTPVFATINQIRDKFCFDKFCGDKFCGYKFSDDMFCMGSEYTKSEWILSRRIHSLSPGCKDIRIEKLEFKSSVQFLKCT